MSLRDRRKLGVNFISVLRAARKITKDPEFEPTTKRELSEKILEEIASRKLPQIRQDDPSLDLDAIIEFIEKLLPIILEIISIFTVI
jgi:hypothetical protein